MANATIVFQNGGTTRIETPVCDGRVVVKKESLPLGASHVDFMPDAFEAKTGADGFILIPSVEGSHHAAATFFKERPDGEFVFSESSMPVYGFCKNGKATLAVVAGMSFEYSLVVSVKNGVYGVHPRFRLDGDRPFEDIEVRFFELSGEDASVAGMARRYRRYQLERGACKPLRERVETQPALKEMALGPEVRIRLAWKPVPSKVDDQTPETEPPVHCELTFKQAEEIVEEFHRQGVKHAEFCVVGWNAGGHDGRFPDLFPVEPKCGSEADLKRLVEKAKSFGYLISCHTNTVEGYSVAKRFKRENVLLDKDLSMSRGGNWGGGKSYFLCPKKAFEDYFQEDAKNLKGLGFKGAHYIDILSIYRPRACWNPAHKLTSREVAEWRSKTLALARETFGASASEGSWDFCVADLDYVLYAAFWLADPKDKIPPVCDEFVPFWFIVYHGIQLYNCFADSVNACNKSDKTLALKNYAWGGRPLSYFNSKFMSGGFNGCAGNPWGEEDIRYSSPEQLRKTVAVIKADSERYAKIRALQYEFIDDIVKLDETLYETKFSNGVSLFANYGDEPAKLADGSLVPPKDFITTASGAKE